MRKTRERGVIRLQLQYVQIPDNILDVWNYSLIKKIWDGDRLHRSLGKDFKVTQHQKDKISVHQSFWESKWIVWTYLGFFFQGFRLSIYCTTQGCTMKWTTSCCTNIKHTVYTVQHFHIKSYYNCSVSMKNLFCIFKIKGNTLKCVYMSLGVLLHNV